jgi:hypothetical protein
MKDLTGRASTAEQVKIMLCTCQGRAVRLHFGKKFQEICQETDFKPAIDKAKPFYTELIFQTIGNITQAM